MRTRSRKRAHGRTSTNQYGNRETRAESRHAPYGKRKTLTEKPTDSGKPPSTPKRLKKSDCSDIDYGVIANAFSPEAMKLVKASVADLGAYETDNIAWSQHSPSSGVPIKGETVTPRKRKVSRERKVVCAKKLCFRDGKKSAGKKGPDRHSKKLAALEAEVHVYNIGASHQRVTPEWVRQLNTLAKEKKEIGPITITEATLANVPPRRHSGGQKRVLGASANAITIAALKKQGLFKGKENLRPQHLGHSLAYMLIQGVTDSMVKENLSAISDRSNYNMKHYERGIKKLLNIEGLESITLCGVAECLQGSDLGLEIEIKAEFNLINGSVLDTSFPFATQELFNESSMVAKLSFASLKALIERDLQKNPVAAIASAP